MISKADWIEENFDRLSTKFIRQNEDDFEDYMREGGLHPDDDRPSAEWDYIDTNYDEFQRFCNEQYELEHLTRGA